jgi:hypothetical protein
MYSTRGASQGFDSGLHNLLIQAANRCIRKEELNIQHLLLISPYHDTFVDIQSLLVVFAEQIAESCDKIIWR